MIAYEAHQLQVVKVELGASVVDKEILTNVKRILPTGYGDINPQTVMSSVPPVDWKRPHKYYNFDVHCLGTIYHAVYHNGAGHVAYDVPSGNNPALPYCKFFLQDENGHTWTVTLTGAIVDRTIDAVTDGEDYITVVRIKAKSHTPLTPT